MKFIDPIGSISILLNDVIAYNKTKNGDPIMIEGKPRILLKRKNDGHFGTFWKRKNFEKCKQLAAKFPECDFQNKTYIQLKGITSEKDLIKKVWYAEIDFMDKKKIAVKYIDDQTDLVLYPWVIPYYQTLTTYYPGTEEILDEEKIHVDDIHVDDIPMEYKLTDQEIIIFDVDDFKSRRMTHVKDVLKYDTIEEFKKSIIISPETKHRPKKQKLDFNPFVNYGINNFHHMTHISNLDNILQYGLLSHNQAHKQSLVQEDISDFNVNELRNREEPIYNNNLHDYVPFYFNPKNPMLYSRLSIEDDILILLINPKVVEENIFLFTDGNAASKFTNIYSKIENLKELDWDCINNDYWNQYRDGKRKKCSEILIYNFVNIDYIDAICCKDTDTKDKVFKNLNNVDIDLITAPELFF